MVIYGLFKAERIGYPSLNDILGYLFIFFLKENQEKIMFCLGTLEEPLIFPRKMLILWRRFEEVGTRPNDIIVDHVNLVNQPIWLHSKPKGYIVNSSGG